MSAQPELYRKPFKPGYLGSYNWPAMALGCTLFLLTNCAATEYIARCFEYQPALGDPLLQVGHTPVYPPFAWFLWGSPQHHLARSRDPAHTGRRYRHPVLRLRCVNLSLLRRQQSAIPTVVGQCRTPARLGAVGN